MLKTAIKKHWFEFILFVIFLIGIVLRLKGFLINPSMWHDECALAWNVKFKHYSEMFGTLRFMQVAPPFFLIATKLIVNIFNVGNNLALCDYVMRLIPFISGVLSIFVLYFICKEVFSQKISIILSLFMFAINRWLIYYSFEFKQYSSDVLCVLLLVLLFMKLRVDNLNYKKLLGLGISLSLIIWFSFVSIFVLAAGFFTIIIKRKTISKVIILFFPLLVSLLLYLRIYVINSYSANITNMTDFWGSGFVLPNLSNLFGLLVANINYFFNCNSCALFAVIMLIWGILLFIKEKKSDFLCLVSLTFIFLIVASILHIYPFAERLIIFLIPLFIMLMVKPFDTPYNENKIKFGLIIFMFLPILFSQINSLRAAYSFKNKGEFPKEMAEIIFSQAKPNDIIFLNKDSNTEFYYYSSFFNMKNKVIQEKLTTRFNENYIVFIKQQLPKNKYYWFYLPYDAINKPVIVDLTMWLKTNTNVIKYYNFGKGNLIYTHIK